MISQQFTLINGARRPAEAWYALIERRLQVDLNCCVGTRLSQIKQVAILAIKRQNYF